MKTFKKFAIAIVFIVTMLISSACNGDGKCNYDFDKGMLLCENTKLSQGLGGNK